MFYLNKNTNIMAFNLLLNATSNLRLVNVIKEAYDNIDIQKVHDVEIKALVEAIKIFSNDIFNAQIYNEKIAKNYFETSSIDEDIKLLIKDNSAYVSDQLAETYINFFAKCYKATVLSNNIESLVENFDKFTKSGLSKIDDTARSLKGSFDHLSKEFAKFDDLTTEMKHFVVDVENKEGNYGLEKLQEDIIKENKNSLFTGTWYDNVTGGLKAECLYIICSISGGGKSLFLQNMIEEISCYMNRDDFVVPDGLTPALLYVNLEISERQLLERRIGFYKGDKDYIIYGNNDGTTFEQRLTKLLKDGGSKIPIIYQTEDSTSRKYTHAQLKTTIRKYEQMGYKIMGVFTDYLDKFHFNDKEGPTERERDEPIVLKAYEHKDIAKEFKIPIITGSQLNTEAEKELKGNLNKAKNENIVKRLNSSTIAKARALTNVPEQIYFCYRYDVGIEPNLNHYFAFVVDKDRDGTSKYVPKPDELPSDRRKNADGRTYYIIKTPDQEEVNKAVFRIGNDYAGCISKFETGVSGMEAFDVDNEFDEEEELEL